ncbi:nucleoid-structuring protein H-NS [Burkholderia ubonensis]|uniref:Homocitrate synthase n=1 Tax=Burkholderia ubonensis TaxID=101571 RepID=A0AB73G145_9BURK|nr:aldolase catalytic domain-containing protein [Burkholderia ubonensis]KVD32274.1 nucleoid-structuring protein H-NS [Burkholderia ubonensis]KVK91593.1 nucleoid-structuring protein H-NS [Burkholderia ubonensis]KVL77797.1 nucleoid-structuring protein H-NS [Burkholderia ubonensis]KVM31175.1 nucleoid-structuring protein H-NS [Burkholderia ubonensis]KVM33560.1 nucleoid-structuring protein H-NS [Burkholderia ubonensis]
MNDIIITDVTLRDGGYRNNFNFTTEFAVETTRRLAHAGIPYVEIGYRKGSFVRKNEHGLTSAVDESYIDALVDAADGKTNLCVMVHPRNIDNSDLEMLADRGVAMVRVCLRRDQLDEGLGTIVSAKRHGLKVSANVTHVTTMPLNAITEMSVRAEDAGADLVVYADSNGNMIPSDTERLISKLASRVAVPLGFHAHNNLSLALSNALAAVDAGAEYIDASLCGMGKGAGNLHLSMIVAYLDRLDQPTRYDLVKVLELSSYAAQHVTESSLPAPLVDIMLGAYNISFDAKQKIAATLADNSDAEWFRTLRRVRDERKTDEAAAARLHASPARQAETRVGAL